MRSSLLLVSVLAKVSETVSHTLKKPGNLFSKFEIRYF
jgi:hypothetical protein